MKYILLSIFSDKCKYCEVIIFPDPNKKNSGAIFYSINILFTKIQLILKGKGLLFSLPTFKGIQNNCDTKFVLLQYKFNEYMDIWFI